MNKHTRLMRLRRHKELTEEVHGYLWRLRKMLLARLRLVDSLMERPVKE